MNNLQLKVKKGDIFWCSSANKMDFNKKTRPFLVVKNCSKLEPSIRCIGLTSNLKRKRGNVVLNTYALKCPSVALCHRIYKIAKNDVHGYITSISAAELLKIEKILKYKNPKISRY